jgi:DNA mismatch endonuclease (patch repair protein)
MRRIKSKNTKPERQVRSILHKSGFRYRLHRADLPGCPDIVFPKKAKVIFVHGCFWHMHTRCPAGRLPRSRVEYWEPKLLRNKARDAAARAKLRRMGWSVLVIWECELDSPSSLNRKLKTFLGK